MRNGKYYYNNSTVNKQEAIRLANKYINLYNSEFHSNSCCLVPNTSPSIFSDATLENFY